MNTTTVYQRISWIVFGAAYGLLARVLPGYVSHFVNIEIISIAVLIATPFAIGAIAVYGLRQTKPSIMTMIWTPWLSILLALAGSAITLLEGSICIALASPLFFIVSSLGGVTMGLVLRLTNIGTNTFRSIVALPLALIFIEPAVPATPQILEERVSIEIAAPPQRIWQEIKTARNIRKEELQKSFTHWIGVPRPIEGVNVETPDGEVRYSKWERGVNFSAHVTNEVVNRSITWRYQFTANSFPKGSMDDHVRIGGQYFDVYDTTFNLTPVSAETTRLEIISHYRVTTGVNFYGVPVARFIAKDFMSTIVHLYKTRSEQSIQTAS